MVDQLFPPDVAARVPGLYSQEALGEDAIVQVKFFCPWGSYTWFLTEFDGDDTFFGLVDGHEEELGYVSLSELRSMRGPGGLRIERDEHWRVRPLRECYRKRGSHEETDRSIGGPG